MSDIKLNFKNQSSDLNNSQVVIFQKNIPADFSQEITSSPTPGFLQQVSVPASAKEIHISANGGQPVPLNIEGISSADIVMTGGGVGLTSTPYTFTLQNIVPAEEC